MQFINVEILKIQITKIKKKINQFASGLIALNLRIVLVQTVLILKIAAGQTALKNLKLVVMIVQVPTALIPRIALVQTALILRIVLVPTALILRIVLVQTALIIKVLIVLVQTVIHVWMIEKNYKTIKINISTEILLLN